MKKIKLSLNSLLLLSISFLFACQSDSIQSYSIPKENRNSIDIATKQTIDFTWTAPSHWEVQPASGFRLASYHVHKGEQDVDISFSKLAGDGGGVLANINRWRGQLNLNAISEKELGSVLKTVTINSINFQLVKLVNTQENTAMTVAMFNHGNFLYFIKAMGSTTLVKETVPDLVSVLESISFK